MLDSHKCLPVTHRGVRRTARPGIAWVACLVHIHGKSMLYYLLWPMWTYTEHGWLERGGEREQNKPFRSGLELMNSFYNCQHGFDQYHHYAMLCGLFRIQVGYLGHFTYVLNHS